MNRLKEFYRKLSQHHLAFLIIVLLISVSILILRKTYALTNAQFWAEDGSVWFSTAYNHHYSLLTIFYTYAGYFNFFPRLIAVLSYFVGIARAPLFFNIIALIVELLPIMYLWSKRNIFIKNDLFKTFMTIFYVLLPYVSEISFNITNSQWFLAIVGFFIILLPISSNRIVRYLENIILLIICFSGPFSIFLSLIIAFNYFFFKNKSINKNRLIIVLFGASTQLALSIFQRSNQISIYQLQFKYLLKIWSGQIFGTGIFGTKAQNVFQVNIWLMILVSIIGLGFIFYILKRGPLILRLFTIYSLCIFIAALISPNNLNIKQLWQDMSQTGSTGRYYFELHLTIVAGLLWLLMDKINQKLLRLLSFTILVLFLFIGIPRDFLMSKYTDYHYASFIKMYNESPAGKRLETIINPGPPWKIDIEKH